MSDFDSIIYEVEDGRARITLNRPEKLNALSLKLQSELNEALWEADNNTDVHCVILRGAGRAFSAGYDLTGADGNIPVSRVQSSENSYRGGRSIDDDAWQLERSQRYRMALFDMHKPVIAQVHGYCLAGGTDVALLTDMIICADDALFGFPPARDLGALPNNMWLYNVGPQWAKRLMLTGDSITGAEAQQIGLVLKAVPKEHLEYEVEQLADRLCKIDPDLLSTNKRIINMGLELMGARTCSAWRRRTTCAATTPARRSASANRWRRSASGKRCATATPSSATAGCASETNGPEFRDEEGRLTDG